MKTISDRTKQHLFNTFASLLVLDYRKPAFKALTKKEMSSLEIALDTYKKEALNSQIKIIDRIKFVLLHEPSNIHYQNELILEIAVYAELKKICDENY